MNEATVDLAGRSASPAHHQAGTSPSTTQPSRRFSPEIHGVRGLALTMVVAFHLFSRGRVSGGVDVFLVISSYLLTGSLLRSLARRDLSLVNRYGRTFSRLLPAALATIMLTIVAGLVVFPRSRWLGLFEEGSAAALFFENIYLATTGLSYEAAGSGASPFQHFWSLSLQGQFFLLWPLLVYVWMKLTSSLRLRLQMALLALVLLVAAAASFWYAIALVQVNQPYAYYSFGPRLWELALGALAAFGTKYASRFPVSGSVAGWIGIGLILTSGFIVDGAKTFPGPWTLWPVMGTLLFLFSAESGGAQRAGLTRVLSVRPMIFLANRGYPLYLVHWPILVFFLYARNQTELGLLGAGAVLIASFIATSALSNFVSRPFSAWAAKLQTTRHGARRLTVTLLALALLVAGAGQAGAALERNRIGHALEGTDYTALGLAPNPDAEVTEVTAADLVPSLGAAFKDLPTIYKAGCVQNTKPELEFGEVLVCEDEPGPNANVGQDADQKRRVVMSGGSHVIQFYPAFREIADQQGWELIVIDKDGCRLELDTPGLERSEACSRWNEEVIPVIADQAPDLLVTVGTRTTNTEGDVQQEAVDDGQLLAWQALNDLDIPILLLRDTPRFSTSMPECLENTSDLRHCGIERSDIYADTNPLEQASLPPLTVAIDVTDSICNDSFCPAVVGNIVAYRDHSHLTATFSKILADDIQAEMLEVVPWMFD